MARKTASRKTPRKRAASTAPSKAAPRKRAPASTEGLSRTEQVLKAFGSRARTIDSVIEALGGTMTDKQVRSALDRLRVRGMAVTKTARRTFSVSA